MSYQSNVSQKSHTSLFFDIFSHSGRRIRTGCTAFVLALVLVFSLFPGALTAQAASFKKKSISSSSKNQSGSYTAKKLSGKTATGSYVNAIADTSIRLLQETMADTSGNTNILISPDSILTALSMVETGASGQTLNQLKNVLGGVSAKSCRQYLYSIHKRISGSKKAKYKIANSLWYKKGKIRLKKQFLQKLVNYFGADVYAAPFNGKTVRDINNWVYNKTRGKIPSILNQLNPLDRAVIINAVYFKGQWATPYTETVKRTFTQENGSKKTVDMLEGTESVYVNVNGADGFVKYYAGTQVAFMGLLPPKGTSLRQYIAGLSGTDLIDGYRSRVTSNIDVRTRMPEFSYDYNISLVNPLRRMGVTEAFSNQASFSNMTSSKIKIDEIIHKTFIAVDRNGTEAAAVTAVFMKATSAFGVQKTVKEVYLDRPFVYALIDTGTGLPLFIGAVYTV